MSQPTTTKKKNKKKKKPLTELNNTVPEVPSKLNNDSKSAPLTITEVLPHHVGMKTTFNDVEVTMTHNGDNHQVVNSSKKKKKKKKSKQQAENTPEVKSGEQDFIKFGEDRIELINHPEISVTIASPVVAVKEPSKPEVKKNSETGKADNSSAVSDQNSTKKKKKKKNQEAAQQVPCAISNQPNSNKKKKKGQETAQKTVCTVNDQSNPQKKKKEGKEAVQVAPTAVSEQSTSKKKKKKKKKNTEPEDSKPEEAISDPSAPTYVKLPAAGDNCVLLVSHESFSSNNKVSVTNTDTVTITSKSDTVLLKRKDLVDQPRNPALTPILQPQPAVSIFPVMQNASGNLNERNVDFNMNASLQKVSDMVNNKTESTESVGNAVTSNPQEPVPSKAQLKAERRAKQEAQRAAKLAKTGGGEVPNQKINAATVKSDAPKDSATKEDNKKQTNREVEPPNNTKAQKPLKEKQVSSKSNIFSHLPQWKSDSLKRLNNVHSKIHPAIIELGTHYVSGLRGSNARCVGFLAAFRDVLKDYKEPPNKEIAKDLESKLTTYLKFLDNCRPLSVSVSNSVRFLKHQISHLPKDVSAENACESLWDSIGNFVREEILLAKEAICISASAKIAKGDVILVFAYSSLVKDALCKAHDQDKTFRVLVADSKHNSEGIQMVKRLREHGLQCSYVPSGSVSIIMKTVSKVMIGAHALLSNGSVMSRAGCKEMALFASYYNVPVLVCCETYKFCERALTDSCVHNELGRPEDLVQSSIDYNESLRDSESLTTLQKYNILYDVTPSDLISVVITEKGLLPTTSVPVVLRVKHAGWQE